MESSPNTPSTSSASSPAPHHPYNPSNPLSAQTSINNSTTASASTSSSSRPRIATPRSMKASRGARSTPPPFTASMQDAQARNKDPYESSEESSDDGGWGGGRWDAYGNESYENVQKRRMAAVILDSPELLMMHSQARCDSIPATRHYFTKLLCGFHDEKDTYPTDGQLPEKEKEKSRDKEKGRRNVSGQSSRR
ncbi:hypothetical protein BKA65DRAFT_219506 [Rhexocercosporidium sp. MPI-PUGE-AT-0058]|nr:hypothetical protein BKA65DRAFT_219506 [Rhexocercosporidium sp. MPI-PUGE-AT-0058]